MLQNQVNSAQALGVAGQISRGRDSYFNTISGVAADANVKIGGFVLFGTNEGEFVGLGGDVAASEANVAGVCIFDNFRDGSEGNDKAKGDTITILTAGSVFVETESVAKAGQFVGIKSGAVVFGDSKTATDTIFTGFRVIKGNDSASRGVIEISTALN